MRTVNKIFDENRTGAAVRILHRRAERDRYSNFTSVRECSAIANSCLRFGRYFLLLGVFLCVIFSGTEAAAEEKKVAFEAEYANTLKYPFHIAEVENASNGRALTIPENAGGEGAFKEERPAAVYHLNLPEKRTWDAWLRVKWKGVCSNSLYFTMGEDNPEYSVLSKTYGKWLWMPAGSWSPETEHVKARILDREDGIKVDQVVLTPAGGDKPESVVDTTNVPTPPEGHGDVELFMASGSPGMSTTDFITKHRPGKPLPLPLRSVLRIVLRPRQSSQLVCWLRNNPAEARTVKLKLRTSARVKIEPKRKTEIAFAPDEALKKVAFEVAPDADMPRHVKNLAVTLKHPNGRIEVKRVLLEKPFQWLVTNAFPCSPEAGIATAGPLEEHINKAFPENIGKVTWRLASAQAVNRFGMVDMRKAVGDQTHAMAYAYTQIHSNKEQEYAIEVRHDDMIAIWVNGEKVFVSTQTDPSYITRKLVKVPFDKGPNHLLVKLTQKKNYWEFCTRVRKLDGQTAPVQGLPVETLVGKE